MQIGEAIEAGRFRFSGDNSHMGKAKNGMPDFNHKDAADWLHRRSATGGPQDHIASLLRKCE